MRTHPVSFASRNVERRSRLLRGRGARTIRPRYCLLLFTAAIAVAPHVQASEPLDDRPRAGYRHVELFEAIRDDEVTAEVVAPDPSRVIVRVRNHTDRPLAIRLPPALGARPVLAQFVGAGPGAPGGGLPGGGLAGGGLAGGGPAGGAGAQGLGFGMPGAAPGGGRAGGGIPGGGIPGGALPGAGGPFGFGFGGDAVAPGRVAPIGCFFNVLPGKTVKQRFESVCLEFGKPDPHRRLQYELTPLATLTSNPRIPALLIGLANRQADPDVAQLAAWRLANRKPWSELEEIERITARGRRTQRYSQQQIAEARRLIAKLPSVTSLRQPATNSPGTQASDPDSVRSATNP